MSDEKIITVNINMSKLDKSALYHGKQGEYLSITLKPREDDYGNHYMVVQDVGKDRRKSGEKGPILGNGKIVWQAEPSSAPKPPPKSDSKSTSCYTEDMDDIPF